MLIMAILLHLLEAKFSNNQNLNKQNVKVCEKKTNQIQLNGSLTMKN